MNTCAPWAAMQNSIDIVVGPTNVGNAWACNTRLYVSAPQLAGLNRHTTRAKHSILTTVEHRAKILVACLLSINVISLASECHCHPAVRHEVIYRHI